MSDLGLTGAAVRDEYLAREAKREKSFVEKHNKLRHRIRELELEIEPLSDLVASYRTMIVESDRMNLPQYRAGLNLAIGMIHNRLERLRADKAKTSETLAELVGGQ